MGTLEQRSQALLNTQGLGGEFTDTARQEAIAWQANPGFDDPTLLDWRAQPFITIDNPGSRDLDQALLIEHTGAGYRVRYALADAAFYVVPGTVLFDEALARGATFYAPGIAAPMLPRILSEGVISLNPHVDRRALVFDMQLRPDGHVTSTVVVRALIHSQAQLTYGDVQAYYDTQAGPETGDLQPSNPADKTEHPWTGMPWCNSLCTLRTLGEVLTDASLQREVIPFNRREMQVHVAGEPPVWVAGVRERYASERYNEQISLLCNRQGALLLDALTDGVGTPAPGAQHRVQSVFRVHDAPPDARLNALQKRLRQLAERRSLGERWHWRGRRQSLASFVAGLPDGPEHARLRQAIEQQVMMSNVASEFRAEPGRHHALAADRYARFSSPMREIVGIFTHKELLEALGSTTHTSADVVLRDQVIEQANNAKQAQKRLDKAIALTVLAQRFDQDLAANPAPVHAGTLVGLRDDRLYVSIDGLALDVKVYLIDLQARYESAYRLNDIEALPDAPTAPAFVLGDAVRVQVDSYDSERQRYVLGLLPGV